MNVKRILSTVLVLLISKDAYGLDPGRPASRERFGTSQPACPAEEFTGQWGRDSCGYPPPISGHSLNPGSNGDANWLERLFASMDNCTPSDFHFDQQAKRSNNGIPEKKGYHAYEIDAHFAKYKVREKFFGFEVTEIAIPSSTDSIYTITVRAGAKNLAAAIKNKTGFLPSLYNKKFEAQSGVAYLVPGGANKSTFVCFTFDGGF